MNALHLESNECSRANRYLLASSSSSLRLRSTSTGTWHPSMGLEMELHLKEKSSVNLSPNTVLPSQRLRSNARKRHLQEKFSDKDDILIIKEAFTEIRFSRYRSASCKGSVSRPGVLECNTEQNRASCHQRSKELRDVKTMGTTEGRRKIEISRSSDMPCSSSILESLCSLDDEFPAQKSLVASQNSELCRPSAPNSEQRSSPSKFIEICLNSDNRDRDSAEYVQKGSMNGRVDNKQRNRSLKNQKNLVGRNDVQMLPKSLSAKVKICHSVSSSQPDHSSRVSLNNGFTPIRKMFDPFTKSKSLRSPSSCVLEGNDAKTTVTGDINRKRTYQKSLLNDFCNTEANVQSACHVSNYDTSDSFVSSSPVHLNGCLKLEIRHGMPSFVFKLKCPEDIFVARTWKAKNACNWIYTFHSKDGRKKSNANRWGQNDGRKDCSMVGQMTVSCYLSSELNDGLLDNSLITEFVVYDVSHGRKSIAPQIDSNCNLDAGEPVQVSNPALVEETIESKRGILPGKPNLLPKSASDSGDCSNLHPLVTSELNPSLEIAAIVIQVPFNKRESLKYRSGDVITDKSCENLLDLEVSDVGQSNNRFSDSSKEKLKVVIPSGKHSLPNTESRGPSTLLDRWRLGGGCDCGGWDMSCPLFLLGNPDMEFADDQPLIENHQPLKLFFQGTSKESSPALTMKIIEDGLYDVDFHAQLSAIQAFSLCVAILHGKEACAGAQQTESQQSSECDQLKVLIEEEMNTLVESVTAKDKKTKVTKTLKRIPPSYVLNPPFSPMARV